MALARNLNSLGNSDLVEKHHSFSLMYRIISRDVKIAAIKLFERTLLDLNVILDCCCFSLCTWYRIVKLWDETGDVVSYKKSLHGRTRVLNCEDFPNSSMPTRTTSSMSSSISFEPIDSSPFTSHPSTTSFNVTTSIVNVYSASRLNGTRNAVPILSPAWPNILRKSWVSSTRSVEMSVRLEGGMAGPNEDAVLGKNRFSFVGGGHRRLGCSLSMDS
jgi:hypothetical protein